MHSDQNSQDMALLALTTYNDTHRSACPSEEALGAYIDGVVNIDMKRDISAHLSRCSRCREQWLEVSSAVSSIEEERAAREEPCRPEPFIHRLQHWLSSLALPATAVALSVVLLILLIPGSPLVTDRLDTISVELSAQLDDSSSQPSKYQTLLPLPWENTSLGFNKTSSSEAQRAFGAGLWQGQLDLGLNNDPVANDPVTKNQVADRSIAENPFLPANACCWGKTQWADYYLLGRWLGLLWWQTLLIEQGDSSDHATPLSVNWAEHRAVLISLQSNFSTMPEQQRLANTLTELDRLRPQLASPVNVTTLHREVLQAIHRLGPTAL